MFENEKLKMLYYYCFVFCCFNEFDNSNPIAMIELKVETSNSQSFFGPISINPNKNKTEYFVEFYLNKKCRISKIPNHFES